MIDQAQAHAKRLDTLRRRINDETYLYAAIQRMALVLSKELTEINTTHKGGNNEQRERRQQPQEQA